MSREIWKNSELVPLSMGQARRRGGVDSQSPGLGVPQRKDMKHVNMSKELVHQFCSVLYEKAPSLIQSVRQAYLWFGSLSILIRWSRENNNSTLKYFQND